LAAAAGRTRKSEDCHENRREFLKTAATGAVLLGSQSKLGWPACLTRICPARRNRQVQSRGGRPGCGAARRTALSLDEKRVLDLLDRAIAAYTPGATIR
jgi:hypothetical protein